MALTGGNACLKYLVFIFNFIFFLIGCGLVGIGIYVRVAKPDFIDLAETLSTNSKYVTSGNLMLVVGAIVLIVAFLGCCGACSENQCMLLMFFNFLTIIFILELAIGIYGFVNKSELEDTLQKDFEDAIKYKYKNGTTDSVIKKTIDKFQEQFECCGYNSWFDWRLSSYYNDTRLIPASCCKVKSATCPSQEDPDEYYSKGCFNEVVEFMKDNVYVVAACGIAFAVIQILGIVFSMLLYCAIRKSKSGTLA